jgi:stage II sporulation protein D
MKRVIRIAAVVASALAGLSACDPPPPAPSVPGQFTFVGGGYGHGVGMSQYGAKGRAEAGMSAAQIVGAYYHGTQLVATNATAPRVHVFSGAQSSLSSPTTAVVINGYTVANAGQSVTLGVSGSSLSLSGPQGSQLIASPSTVTWWQGERMNVSGSGRGYRYGSITARAINGALELIVENQSMEQYLYGLGEVPSSWPMEAMKAQAIAARTYARRRINSPQSSRFDLYSTVQDQAFIGADQTSGTTGPRWRQAVDETANLVLYYRGSLIEAYYDASNGGHNEDSGYVWSTSLPYLSPIADPYDNSTGNPYFSWTRTYTGEELGAWLAASGRGNVGTVTSIRIGGNVGVSGRTNRATVTVVGSGGTVTMTGSQLRSAVNAHAAASRQLRTTKFTVS